MHSSGQNTTQEINGAALDKKPTKLSLSGNSDFHFRHLVGIESEMLMAPQYSNHSTLLSLPPESHVLFEHYLHRTASVMSPIQGEANPFLSKLLPISLSHDFVLHSLLTFSGVHRADSRSLIANPITWFHYAQALKGLKYGLTEHASGDHSKLVPMLIVTLMFVFIEGSRCNESRGIIAHLKASRQLLFSALKLPTSQLDAETRNFLVEVYAFAAIIANITLGPESDGWILEDATALLPMVHPNEHQLLTISGCPTELFELVPRVSRLASKHLIEQESLGYTSWGVVSEHLSIRSKLERWTSDSRDSHVIACHQIYQQAILVYLESAFAKEGSINYTSHIQHGFDILTESLLRLPVESPHATTLCWPLVVFGSYAKTSIHQNIIRQRLLDLHKVIGANNLKETSRFLENLWSQKNLSYKPSTIFHILRQQCLELYFF